jgi:septum formation protein
LTAPLVLASASPRRLAILRQLGLVPRVVPADVDETPRAGEGAEAFVERAARDKALQVAQRVADERPAPYVLGADTAVVLDERILGKPRDDGEARAMIETLGGRVHRVVTGVAVLRAGCDDPVASTVVSAEVRFRAVTSDVVARYVDSGEGRDKAGAYAVQGLGAGLVESVNGSYHGVVGLPSAQTLQLLARAGALEAWP